MRIFLPRRKMKVLNEDILNIKAKLLVLQILADVSVR
jgi:hypothetical protein